MMGMNKTLETIELDGNKFSSNGIDKFLSALEKNYTISDLLLNEKDASDDQLDKLDDLINRNIKKKERSS